MAISPKRRILITGNEGYIAENLKTFFEDRGFIVGGFDRKNNVYTETFQLPKKHGLFAIVHLAGVSGLEECEGSPEAAVKSNIIGSANIFQQGLNHDIPIIFVSSQAAKNASQSVYGTTKYFAECYADYFNSLGAQIRILRLCNVFGGPNYLDKKSSVIAKFLRAKMESKPIIVHGEGTQKRDFVHVDDVCEAIFLSLFNFNHDLDVILDVGTGEGTQIIDLANMITGDIQFSNERDIGISSNIANTSLTNEIIGFQPTHTLSEYISSFNN